MATPEPLSLLPECLCVQGHKSWELSIATCKISVFSPLAYSITILPEWLLGH